VPLTVVLVVWIFVTNIESEGYVFEIFDYYVCVMFLIDM